MSPDTVFYLLALICFIVELIFILIHKYIVADRLSIYGWCFWLAASILILIDKASAGESILLSGICCASCILLIIVLIYREIKNK